MTRLINMGAFDRFARALVVAPILVGLGIHVGPGSVAAIVLYALAGVMVGTAAVGFCPLYPLVHVSTCPRKPSAA